MSPFIADFYCAEARLVVEIDGPSHRDDQLIHDDRRDAWMHERGIRVLRVSGKLLFRNLRGVLSTIARVANEHMNPSSRAPAGEVPERSEGGGGNPEGTTNPGTT
jgi:very-short-patch-repair endonuclease